MPDEVFAAAFGTEWFIEPGVDAPPARRLAVRPRLMAGSTSSATAGPPAAGTPTPIPGSTTSAARRPSGGRPAGAARPATAVPRDQPAAALPGDRRAARRRVGHRAEVEPLVAEIPSPEGVPMGSGWRGCGRRWPGRGPRSGRATSTYRDARRRPTSPGCRVRHRRRVSHFIAINAAIGRCTGDDRVVIRSLDNTSVTVVETSAGGAAPGRGRRTRPTP